jgi:hypothetical protein
MYGTRKRNERRDNMLHRIRRRNTSREVGISPTASEAEATDSTASPTYLEAEEPLQKPGQSLKECTSAQGTI